MKLTHAVWLFDNRTNSPIEFIAVGTAEQAYTIISYAGDMGMDNYLDTVLLATPIIIPDIDKDIPPRNNDADDDGN